MGAPRPCSMLVVSIPLRHLRLTTDAGSRVDGPSRDFPVRLPHLVVSLLLVASIGTIAEGQVSCSAKTNTTIVTPGGNTQEVTKVTATAGSQSATIYRDAANNVVRVDDINFWGDYTSVDFSVVYGLNGGGFFQRNHITYKASYPTEDGSESSGNHSGTTADQDSDIATKNAKTTHANCP